MKLVILNVRRTLALFLTITVLACSCLTGCGNTQVTINEDKDTGELLTDVQKDFENYTENIFLEEVVADTITLHYTLLNPSDFGIDDYDITLGEYGVDAFEQSTLEMTEYLNELHDFDYDALTESEQLTYDILEEYFETQIAASDLYLFAETLSPTIGTQAELPTIFAEYTFNTEQDVKDYLKLLKCFDEYYEQLLDFEKLKSENGTFMSDFAADAIISQCKAFIDGDIDDNYLVSSFNERISDVEGLSKSDIKSYKKKNKKLVKNHVLPAYETLISGLEKLKGTGKNDGGLCNFDKGSEYYEYLIKSVTGSSKSVDEIKTMIENELNASILGFYSLAQDNNNLYSSMSDYSFSVTKPKDILDDLLDKISNDFPEPVTTDYTIKYVPESLQDNLSPAFYLKSPIDALDNNVIYINNNPDYDSQDLYTTLAHEGYPGHLYQTTYFSSTNPSHIRELLSFTGYSEGWATYVELYAYQISGLDDYLATALQYNTSFALAVYSLVDIGINYEGWTQSDTADFLDTYYVTDDDMAKEIYERMIEEPGNYLKYYVGYLEFKNLLSEAQTALGDDFVLKDFHEFLLTTGPAQFDIIEKYLNKWIENQ